MAILIATIPAVAGSEQSRSFGEDRNGPEVQRRGRRPAEKKFWSSVQLNMPTRSRLAVHWVDAHDAASVLSTAPFHRRTRPVQNPFPRTRRSPPFTAIFRILTVVLAHQGPGKDTGDEGALGAPNDRQRVDCCGSAGRFSKPSRSIRTLSPWSYCPQVIRGETVDLRASPPPTIVSSPAAEAERRHSGRRRRHRR